MAALVDAKIQSPPTPSSVDDEDMKGWLFKWTNYIKGYQKRWFVLSNGVLSYYRTQAEISQLCRGTISLHGATIHTEDSCTIVISNGGAQTFHLRATSEVERQRWVTALELAKAREIVQTHPDRYKEKELNTNLEVTSAVSSLNKKLSELRSQSEIISKHSKALQRCLTELESIDLPPDVSTKIKAWMERANLIRIASVGMVTNCSEYLDLAQSQGNKWQKMLYNERRQRIQLVEMVDQIAREQTVLEHVANSDKQDSCEFFDAQGGDTFDLTSNNYLVNHQSPNILQHKSLSSTQALEKLVNEELDCSGGSSSDIDDPAESSAILTAAICSSTGLKSDCDENNKSSRMFPELSEHAKKMLEDVIKHPLKPGDKRRCRVPDKPNHPLHIWSILKNCIGKDLSKIPMPVNFSEPLSMLQRITEDFEYSSILDTAAQCKDPFEQLAYVAAFTISSYSTTVNRTSKPFNPLLGETYECDRMADLGWKAFNEQVSHHPPISAQYCSGKEWFCWQEFSMSSKFRGKYLQAIPNGTAHLDFPSSGNHYTWTKVTTTVHNIIVGKLWVDQTGDMTITNHKDGSKCRLSYIPYSYFTRDQQRKVKGYVFDKDNEIKWVVNGTWDNKIEIAPVTKFEGPIESPTCQTGNYILAWHRQIPPSDNEKYYNFTVLASQLNEMEEGVAPTDSRYRSDQRLMEFGLWDEANIEKLNLEEMQRNRNRRTNAAVTDSNINENEEDDDENFDENVNSAVKPLWFKRDVCKWTNKPCYTFTHEYWECKQKQDWTRCPSLF
ncbi:Oxysterol-binding protein,Oxysterol-binding protein, conserved site,Pleckstrin homology domain,PH [Cinara cedri]|uniref:Oxysterol-binding protein n=1 Tax=Cinara cedri TaxID=506608 RepID=A0A5E4M9N6_9HEMI|nr:Oxysterol-binding protein,Oxysterol-binding protein, conserved site,Pleckstrin homology domain,PH [Cinara cedri]